MKKLLKKIGIVAMLAAVTALGLTGCGGSSGDEDVIKVGLVQLVEHTSLDQIR